MVVVGGAGFFGGRLVRGLLDTTDLRVVVAGRDFERARRFVESLGAGGRAAAARLDARRTAAEELRAFGAFALVDAAGPFQDADHRLAEAAIAAGLHYLDLADGRTLALGPWECVVIPAGTVHRTRAVGRTVNLTVEALGAETVFVDAAGDAPAPPT